MEKAILFSLEQCVKCGQTKSLLKDRIDVEIITFPHDISQWTEEQKQLAHQYEVFEDLHQTAPILWVDGQKHIGFLRIRKWIQDTST